MKKPKKEPVKSTSFEDLKDLGRKYGIEVIDMSESGVQSVGVLGGTYLHEAKQNTVRESTAKHLEKQPGRS